MRTLSKQRLFIQDKVRFYKIAMRSIQDQGKRDFYREQYLMYLAIDETLNQFDKQQVKYIPDKGDYGENLCPLCHSKVGYNAQCPGCGTYLNHNTLSYSKED